MVGVDNGGFLIEHNAKHMPRLPNCVRISFCDRAYALFIFRNLAQKSKS